MNTNKIREALKAIENALMMSRSTNENRGDHYDGWCTQALPFVDVIRAELNKAQPAKVLTDEEIERIVADTERPIGNPVDPFGYGLGVGLRYARDNVYLAPAPPVDIERIMDVVDQVADFNTWSVPRIQRLRDLLTNALTHKP